MNTQPSEMTRQPIQTMLTVLVGCIKLVAARSGGGNVLEITRKLVGSSTRPPQG